MFSPKPFSSTHLKYVFVSLLSILPLLKSGYVQTFDMPWGPHSVVADSSSNLLIVTLLIRVFSAVISSMMVQKIILLGIFLMGGLGAHRLIQGVDLIKENKQAAYIAGVLYMFNPFVYTRLMAGQWLVLVGYALLPWAVGSLWELMQRPGLGNALRAGGWTVAIGLTSIHAVGFVALLGLLLFKAAGWEGWRKRALWCGAGTLLWLAVDSIWLVPLLFGDSHTASQISSFGPSQLRAFATQGTVAHSVPLSALLLEGFWADPQGRYYLPSHLGFWWYGVAVLLGGLVAFGAYKVVRRRDKLGVSVIIAGVIAWWLAMGVGSSWSSGTTNFLVHYLPFYRGYREPEKWLMVLALAYSYLAAVGTAQLLPHIKRVQWRQPALSFGLLLPVLFTPLLLLGADGQLVSAEYPADWAVAEQRLDADHTPYQVLVLPWHEYLPISFAKRVVANPANHYFKQSLIISDNPELAGVPPTESTPLYRLLDNQLLPQARFRSDATAQLAPYHVKYVLLLKEADYRSYSWLPRQQGFQLIQNSATLQLYKVMSN